MLKLFDEEGAQRVANATRQVEQQPWNRQGQPGAPTGVADGQKVYNDSGDDIPPYGILRPTGDLTNDKLQAIKVAKPDSTLRPTYYIAPAAGIPKGGIAIAQQLGTVQVAYEDSAHDPALGDFYGPAPDQWEAALGWPSLIGCQAIFNSDRQILSGEYSGRIRSVMGKAAAGIGAATGTTTITPGSDTVTVWIWDGSDFVVSDPPMTFEGVNTSLVPIEANKLVRYVESGGLWIADSSENFVYLADANADIANTAAGDFTLSDGRVKNAWNVSGDDIYSGSAALLLEDRSTEQWYAINPHVPLVRFELTADLVYGTNPSGANAKVLVYSSGSYSATGLAITVYDWGTFGGSYGNWAGKAPRSGDVGFQGFAVLKSDSNRFEIVWMESMARFVRCTLTTQLTTTSASVNGCTVNYYWDGRNPDPGSAGITLYNLNANGGNYQFSGDNGDVVYAVRDDLDRYRIFCGIPRIRRRVKALINNASGFKTTDATVAVDTVTTLDGSSAPTITSASNTLKLYGNDDDIVILEEVLSGASSTWFIAEIQPVRAPRRFKCLLNGALTKGTSTATIDSISSFDGTAAPAPTSAANFFKLDAPDDTPGIIVEDWSSGSVTYILEQLTDRKARYVQGTLNGSIGSGTVSLAWDGVAPSSPISLSNTGSVFTYVSNVAYLAAYNPETDSYQLIWIGC
jgi:hypothetical protein